jgi:hypothetical protein
LRLVERFSGAEIASSSKLSLIEDAEMPVTTVEALVGADPTLIDGVWQLKLCEPLFMTYISNHGVDSFLSAAYAYVLSRPMDAHGLTMYRRSLKQGTLTALGILLALEDSDEFKSRPRMLAAPSANNFPFQ